MLPVAAGDVLTQRQLLEAALLKSAANATMTLADWAFGGAEGYVAAAERWLEERGIDGITVADVHWICERVNRLTDRQWRDAFRAGGFEPSVAARFIARIKARAAEGLALKARETAGS